MQTNRRTWQSMDEVLKAAEQGDSAAQTYLGICFQTAQGMQQDYAEDHTECTGRYARAQEGTKERSQRGCNFEEHADADIRKPVAHISGRSPR